jgi:hypothetical protein
VSLFYVFFRASFIVLMLHGQLKVIWYDWKGDVDSRRTLDLVVVHPRSSIPVSSTDFCPSTSRSPSIMKYEESETRLGEYQTQDLDSIACPPILNFESTPNCCQGLSSHRHRASLRTVGTM